MVEFKQPNVIQRSQSGQMWSQSGQMWSQSGQMWSQSLGVPAEWISRMKAACLCSGGNSSSSVVFWQQEEAVKWFNELVRGFLAAPEAAGWTAKRPLTFYGAETQAEA